MVISFINCKFSIKVPIITVFLIVCAINSRAFVTTKFSTEAKDSIKKDTIRIKKDSLKTKTSPNGIDAEIKYNAKDSIIFDVENKMAYLYGSAHITYQDIALDAAKIIINWQKDEVYAEGMKDTSGKMVGMPVFKEKDQSYKSSRMAYNFKSKKGKVFELVTNEGEGYIHVPEGKYVKSDSSNIIYARDAKYTTCSDNDPHFYIKASKLKIIPKDKIITSTSVMYIEDVPIPLILPFGFFPAQSRRSSGLVFPTYGEDQNRGGFFLRGLGYYFGLSDYWDVKATGDFYANGGWGTIVTGNYSSRYHALGSLNFGFSHLIVGLEDTKQEITQQFNINWMHRQDPKENPGFNFTSSVNFGSAKYLQNNSFDLTQRLNNNMSSNIVLSKTFALFGTTSQLSAALTHSQNSQTRSFTMQLPQLNYSISRFTLFKSHATVVKPHWWDNLGMDYNAKFLNNINTTDTTLFKSNFADAVKKLSVLGFTQTSNLNVPIKVKFFTLTPGINYTGYGNFKQDLLNYDAASKSLITDTRSGLFYSNTYKFSAQLSTQLYGTFMVHALGIEAIRHVMTPTITFQYVPNFGAASNYGYYRYYTDTTGKKEYNTFARSIIGSPDKGHFGGINFGLNNFLETKVKSAKDTATGGFKKIKIFDQFNITNSYNFIKDSMKLDVFNIVASTTILERFTINSSAILDPYKVDQFGHDYNKFMFNPNDIMHSSFGRITSFNFSTGFNLNPKAQKKANEARNLDPRVGYYYPGTYVDFTVPWNLNINYTYGYSNAFVVGQAKNITQTVQANGGLQLTPNWKIEYRANYDIKNASFNSSSINFTRDLHCWVMKFQWVPLGIYKSYYFTINIKSPTLKDLKYDKRENYQSYYK